MSQEPRLQPTQIQSLTDEQARALLGRTSQRALSDEAGEWVKRALEHESDPRFAIQWLAFNFPDAEPTSADLEAVRQLP